MRKKIWIILFFAVIVGVEHALPLQGLAFALLQDDGTPCPPECVTDSMEIVTWYPSPYNEYEELRLYPKFSADESDCNSGDKLGLMYYNKDQQALKICWQDPSDLSYSWENIGLAQSGLFRLENYSTSSRPGCGNSILGALVYDTTEKRPYVCALDASNTPVWKPLDSDYDKDGITDMVDANDKDLNDATAVEANVETGKTFYARGGSRKTGTGVFGSPGFLKVKIFDNDGSFQIPNGVNSIAVEVWGGGGGGGNGGSCSATGYDGGAAGGGGGGYGQEVLSVSPGGTYFIVIGNGGNSASNGGSTYFKKSDGTVLVSASGGITGMDGTCDGTCCMPPNNSSGGIGGESGAAINSAGGSGSTNFLNWGGYGGEGGRQSPSSSFSGGAGGRGGTWVWPAFEKNGFDGKIPGGGGGGGAGPSSNPPGSGGKGGKGRVVISYS